MNDQPVAQLRSEIKGMQTQLMSALPQHIPVERFSRVLMTAVQNNPDLLGCGRQSLWNAVMQAAQDGLLPDGREGAIVPYKSDATWMPMIGGIRKKARNSGDISTWDVRAAYEKDVFQVELGDDERIVHRPSLGDRGKLIAVYSIATLKDGTKSRDYMTVPEIEKIRKKSKAKNGPWNDATFYDEMAKKTLARRHSKQLPTSADLDDLIRRDDHFYDISTDKQSAPRSRGLVDQMAALADNTIDGSAEPQTNSKAKPAEQGGKKAKPNDQADDRGAPPQGEAVNTDDDAEELSDDEVPEEDEA